MYPSPRVSQLDAGILDSEITSLLKTDLAAIFQLQNGSWVYERHPELWDLILNLLIFRLTVWKTGSSYGSSLQNLKLSSFRDGKLISSYKRTILGGVIVGGYLWHKLESYLYSVDHDTDSGSRMYLILYFKSIILKYKNVILSCLNDSFKIINLLNFTAFLISGRFPSVLHRILGISYTPIVSELLKFNGDNVNFEFQNRQLVWNVMTEFLVFILPLLQFRKLRRMATRILKSHKTELSVEPSDKAVETPYASLPISQCAICKQTEDVKSSAQGQSTDTTSFLITNPFVTNCGHIFCYVCIASKFNHLENAGFDSEGCLRCGRRLAWFREYGTDEKEYDDDAIIVSYTLVDDTKESSENEISEKDDADHENNSQTSSDESDEFSEEEDFEEDEAFGE